ncbi:hypothetical protein [Kineosporia sp. NBRC 101731]|uniref:hypothetical protein n=1 Tax=Kineosporia sp. NBRC 101731 TaxID=3032199 RepID=UPI0024A52195|nr:hypothetical protein [Kineosporia sp. NBRC 101731]GLY30855.1 hypothetical protein Kisp02_42200 [Kineosporia sp. NBRC 101731]
MTADPDLKAFLAAAEIYLDVNAFDATSMSDLVAAFTREPAPENQVAFRRGLVKGVRVDEMIARGMREATIVGVQRFVTEDTVRELRRLAILNWLPDGWRHPGEPRTAR